jgi:hypothetical protein
MINWSFVLLLHLSVAHGHSHELAALMVLALAVLWMSAFGHHKLVHGLSGDLGDDVVGAHFLRNFSEASELVDCQLPDWDDLFDNIPENALGARSGGQGALVGESTVVG